ncbi:MAG: UDP-N-acetylmuramate--L-alanine ligase [Spirochaetaceae bacterium]|jgi:UDP-N-acetylmuramate--alanine ligase|nr:UDP-N-acetylmuramate--L-alanine ligase [Spirochaetaceae bacterium]
MNKHIYMVGIKGTGMAALAELLQHEGALLGGADTSEKFYTDDILHELKIPYHEGFNAANIIEEIDKNGPLDEVIYSAAYSPDTNPELAEARRQGIALKLYPEALGDFSGRYDSTGICGVHGKTTTTALCGTVLQALQVPARILVGSAVNWPKGGEMIASPRSTLSIGDNPKYFVAETCEYRRHFLDFHPSRIILTSVESDHQDYYPGFADIQKAFIEYIHKLPKNGSLIYCADDAGAVDTVHKALKDRPDIQTLPYGWTAEGDYKITSFKVENERIVWTVAAFGDCQLKMCIPGRHTALNATAALALASELINREPRQPREQFVKANNYSPPQIALIQQALEDFRGSKRRSELLGEYKGILFIDDYGHHPTAIRTTLAGYRAFYPGRRIIVSFMSHTSSRTAALLDDFAQCFDSADVLFLHKIYASARHDDTAISGRTLYEQAKKLARPGLKEQIYYYDDYHEALQPLLQTLHTGDVFITMGAGDNWQLGKALIQKLQQGGSL